MFCSEVLTARGNCFEELHQRDEGATEKGMGLRSKEAMEENQVRAKGKASFHRPRWPSLPLRR